MCVVVAASLCADEAAPDQRGAFSARTTFDWAGRWDRPPPAMLRRHLTRGYPMPETRLNDRPSNPRRPRGQRKAWPAPRPRTIRENEPCLATIRIKIDDATTQRAEIWSIEVIGDVDRHLDGGKEGRGATMSGATAPPEVRTAEGGSRYGHKAYARDVRLQTLVHCKRRQGPSERQWRGIDSPARSGE
jgi:hypothetical protein